MKTILAAIDFSPVTEAILEQASALAKAFDGKLWILHAASDETQALAYDSIQFGGYASEFISMPGDVQLARDLCANEFKREHNQLLALSAQLRKKDIDAQGMLLNGNAASLILEKAGDVCADIIVLGSHGHGILHKALLGSVSEAVLNHARCSVMVVPRERQ